MKQISNLKLSVCMASIAALASGITANAQIPRIVASVYDHQTGETGMYRLPDAPGGELTKLSSVSSYYGGSLDPRGEANVYYACHDGRYSDYWDTDSDPHGHKIRGYDTETWQPVGPEMNLPTYRSSDMAIHPQTGTAYAFCDYGSMMYNLFAIDLTDGSSTQIYPGGSTMLPDDSARAMAFAPDGTLYGVTKVGKFGTIDLSTGRLTPISSLGISMDLRHQATGAIDPDTGNFIFIFNTNEGGYNGAAADEIARIYSIKPSSGEKTLLASFPGKEITSMYIEPDRTAPTAPGIPGELSADLPGGSLSGTLGFTMPSSLYDGSPASGTANWTIADGTTPIASGEASYGIEISAYVTFAEGGLRKLSFWASNDAGEGKKNRASLWVGPDVPMAPQNVMVSFDEPSGTFDISWDAVSEGEHGGFVNPSAIKYDVVRMPGEEKIAEGISPTNFTYVYVPSGIESVSFKVVACQGELESAPGLSLPVTAGSVALPYDLMSGDYYTRLENWTIEDVNDDGSTWENYSDGPRYKYSSSNAADDWLISPPFNAMAGCHYKVNVAFHCQSTSYPERIEAKYGYAASSDAMTEVLLPATDVRVLKADRLSFELDLVPDQDGKFFIGFHAISDRDKYYLYLTDLKIAPPIGEGSPEACTDLAVTADRGGELQVSGRGVAPTFNTEGGRLPSLSKIEIRRDNISVFEIENPMPGEEFEFADSLGEPGNYSYTATAFNGDAAGVPSEAKTVYVGINRPGTVSNIHIEETDIPGEIHVSWNAPEKDWEGNPLNGDLSYKVEIYPDNAYYHGNYTETGIEGTECTLTPSFADGRDHGFVFVKVSAVNSKGEGFGEKSDNIPVGNPIATPFRESFPNYTLEHPWGDGRSNGPQIASISDDERSMSFTQYNGWNRMMDRSFPNSEGAQDGDNGFAGMFGWSYADDSEEGRHNEFTELLSPKIDLAGLESPMLTLYTYNWLSAANGQDINELDIDVICQGERQRVSHTVIKDLGSTQRWELLAVDLAQYKGKVVSLVITGTVKSQNDQGYNWVLIDNIRIADMAPVDVEVTEIQAPVKASPGEPFEVSAYVCNKGSQELNSLQASLVHNGKVVELRDLDPLGFNKGLELSFETALTPLDPIGNNYSIKVDAEGDADVSNNESATATVARNIKLLPEPQNAFYDEGRGGNFQWMAPDLSSAAPEPTFENFEAYTSFENEGIFTTEVGEWILVDVDQKPIGGMINNATMEMLELPGIPTHSRQSWWVQSRYFEDFNDSYYGHSGVNYLANMYVVNESFTEGESQDDWAISPELCGREQLVSLWARSYSRDYPETVEFWYSEGSTAPEDFTLLKRHENISPDWTEYIMVVPEGGLRFAIRGCSYAPMGTAQTFIDDVTFVGAGSTPQELHLIGYNIYRGNELTATCPAGSAAYQAADGAEYSISALYEEGESRAVEVAEGSAIRKNDSRNLCVSSNDGQILITGLQGMPYCIFDASGRIMASGIGADRAVTDVEKGVYVIRAAGRTFKAIAK